MKKTLILSLALVLVLGIASTAFAADNPFLKVPTNHWAYDSVKKLGEVGIISGYSDNTFRGDKTITRLEMAKMVAKAMARYDKANAEQQVSIDKLSAEFKDELKTIGVRIAKLEQQTDNVTFTNEMRLRYNHDYYTDNKGLKRESISRSWRARFKATGEINDTWKYTASLENTQNLTTNTGADSTKMNMLYVKGPVGDTNVAVGRMPWFSAYGIVADSSFDGVKVELGNKLKTSIFYGKEYGSRQVQSDGKNNDRFYTSVDSNGSVGTDAGNTVLTGIEMRYAASKNTNFRGGYFQLKAVDQNTDYNDMRFWEAGFDTKPIKNLKFIADYCQSNAYTQNKGYFVMMLYKAVNSKNVGSFMPYIDYRNMQLYGQWDSTVCNNNIVANNPMGKSSIHGSKGWETGVAYVPMVNTILFAYYTDCKGTDNSGIRDRRYRIDWYLYF